MRASDWITIAIAVVAIAGWFVNSWLNRRHEIAKRRMERREQALLAFLPVWDTIQNSDGRPFEVPGFLENLRNVRIKFQLYGYQGEVEVLEGFIAECENGSISNANEKLHELIPLVLNKARKELGLRPLLRKN